MDVQRFDPTSPLFRDNPYPFYVAFRNAGSLHKIGAPYNAWWVFGHKLVGEANQPGSKFLKPGKDRGENGQRPFSVVKQFGDGLFFMDPPRHTQVRPLMDEVVAAAIEQSRERARSVAHGLLDAAIAGGRLDVTGSYASGLARTVFMECMGIPSGADQVVLDRWVRDALNSHDKALPAQRRVGGATATMAMRAYFLALGKEVAAKDKKADGPANSILAGMQARTACPKAADRLSTLEAMNTAVHFALGGYLSTEFLIASGIYNLLRHPEQRSMLQEDPSLLTQAVYEMLRFDAPFQMADRWLEEDASLGTMSIPAKSMVTLVYGSANRDPDKFQDPDRFDITRSAAGNVGFGGGIHQCIGAKLAMSVTEAALSALLERCPGARIGDVGPWSGDPYFRSLTRLTLLLR